MSKKATSLASPRRRVADKTKAKLPFDNQDATEKAHALRKHPKDPARIAALYEVLKPMVDRALETKFARGVQPACRDDLSQDILLRVIDRLVQFDENKASLFNWVTSIVRTMSIDYYRKSKREVPRELVRHEAQPEQPHLEIDARTLGDMRSFFPLYISTAAFHEMYAAAERYKFKVNNNLTAALGEIFRRHHIDYAKYGTLGEFAQFTVALYRAWMVDEVDYLHEHLEQAMQDYTPVNVVKILQHYLHPKQLAVLLHICGGMQVKLPSPKKILRDQAASKRLR